MTELLDNGQPPVPVPDTLAWALDPAWLTAALGRRFPGLKVDAVEPGPVVSRVSTNARFRVEIEGGTPEGLSEHLCVKGYFSDCSESGAASSAAGIPEALFYRDFAATSGVRTLDPFYADVDFKTMHGVVITQDVVIGGATFIDALSPYSPDQVAQSLEQLAVLHGRSWHAADRLAKTWLRPQLEVALRSRDLDDIRSNLETENSDGVPEPIRDAKRLLAAFHRLSVHVSEGEDHRCLIHGDAHVNNLYLNGSGQPCLLDWQLVQHAPWYLDVGYHIACTLNTDERRANEADLLSHYLDRLRGEGVELPPEVERCFALGVVYGFFLWAITIRVGLPIRTVMLQRLGTALSDCDAYRYLEA